jgi:hypothetical protein
MSTLTIAEYKIAARNKVFLNVFEICTAFIISFISVSHPKPE